MLIKIWVFPKIGVPQIGWFIMEKPIKWMIWGYQKFRKPETPIWICFKSYQFGNSAGEMATFSTRIEETSFQFSSLPSSRSRFSAKLLGAVVVVASHDLRTSNDVVFFPKRWQILIYIYIWFQRCFGIFTPNLGGKNPILTIIFFRWVGSTTNLKNDKGKWNIKQFSFRYTLTCTQNLLPTS